MVAMSDQADHLRELMQTAAVGARPADVPPLPLVVVSGARVGVGAATVAVNVGAALVDRGERVLVIDAAEGKSNVMDIAGVRAACGFTLADVVAGRCAIEDAVVSGAAGVTILAVTGHGELRRKLESSPRRTCNQRDSATVGQLLAQLQKLRDRFDVFVVNTGAGLTQAAQRLWLRARSVLLVTNSDDAVMMDAYAAIKRHVTGAPDATCDNVRVLVNQSTNDRESARATDRLVSCCNRFLKCDVKALSALPAHFDVESAGMWPRVWESPDSEFGHAVLWLGRVVGDSVLRVGDAGCGEQGTKRFTLPASSIQRPAPTC
jgi:flagellar biosynthesis protein FlhG